MSFANRAHKAIAFPAAGMISCGWMMWDAEGAFNDRTLAQAIAEFKGRFFRENDGNPIDYTVAISGEFDDRAGTFA